FLGRASKRQIFHGRSDIPIIYAKLNKLHPVAKTNSLALPANNWRKTKDAFLFDNEVERWPLNFFYGLSDALIAGFMENSSVMINHKIFDIS
ncbi:hypothetical protein L6R21_21490, partial [bacterium]|nr:hypothetical protein [bacterium]